ncbi:hypothetical protein ACIREK_31035 [Streptomyces sp. NPDC102415]|uniref:hypothetical protein n=1 Tax=Streptomyces sp. NPDC102415 TaxID=3366173 RepID=UPI003805708A
MTTTPADELRAAAERAREIGDPLHTALAQLLDGVMSSNREADHEECQRWCSPETCDLSAALAVARQVLGTVTECPECGNTGACNGGPCPLGTVIAPPESEAAPERVKHSGPATAFCVLCLSGEHEQVADEQPETEAYPAQHQWRTETHDPLANEWNPSTAYPDRADAVYRHQVREERFPTWKDGARVERRIVRLTTTYTVEQPAPAVTAEAPQPTTTTLHAACPGAEPGPFHPNLCPCPCTGCETDCATHQQPAPAVNEEAGLCGKTIAVDGTTYPPCARHAGHSTAYCRDSAHNSYFLAAPAVTEEAK